jgi:hypothetical protein
MRHRLLAGVVLVAAGCAGTQYYRPPQERLPAPADAGGTAVAVEDRRPEWERQPFTGAICLYHPGKARPNPWDGVAREARDAATTLPDRPERVTVGVTSFRLVRHDAEAVRWMDARHPDAYTRGFDLLAGWLIDRAVGTRSEQAYRPELRDHPPGASCAIRAEVRLDYPDGRTRTVPVAVIAAEENVSGTAYWGEALDTAAAGAVRQFGRHLRQEAGLPRTDSRGPT